MIREIMKPRCKGQTVEIELSRWGYQDYYVQCTYHFDKREGKYMLSMWLCRSDIEDRMLLSSKKTDAQYLSGTRDTIVENICRVVHYAATVTTDGKTRYFDRYVERYEYELACFQRGNELFEQENAARSNNE